MELGSESWLRGSEPKVSRKLRQALVRASQAGWWGEQWVVDWFVPILSSLTPQLFSQGLAWPLAWGFSQVEKEVKGGREPADMQDLFPGDEGVGEQRVCGQLSSQAEAEPPVLSPPLPPPCHLTLPWSSPGLQGTYHHSLQGVTVPTKVPQEDSFLIPGPSCHGGESFPLDHREHQTHLFHRAGE